MIYIIKGFPENFKGRTRRHPKQTGAYTFRKIDVDLKKYLSEEGFNAIEKWRKSMYNGIHYTIELSFYESSMKHFTANKWCIDFSYGTSMEFQIVNKNFTRLLKELKNFIKQVCK